MNRHRLPDWIYPDQRAVELNRDVLHRFFGSEEGQHLADSASRYLRADRVGSIGVKYARLNTRLAYEADQRRYIAAAIKAGEIVLAPRFPFGSPISSHTARITSRAAPTATHTGSATYSFNTVYRRPYAPFGTNNYYPSWLDSILVRPVMQNHSSDETLSRYSTVSINARRVDSAITPYASLGPRGAFALQAPSASPSKTWSSITSPSVSHYMKKRPPEMKSRHTPARHIPPNIAIACRVR
jgi:hypothetical protein